SFVDLHEWAHFDEGTLVARANDIAGLRHHDETKSLLLGEVYALFRCGSGRIGYRKRSVEAMSEPVLTVEHAVALAPRSERLIDRCCTGIAFSAHPETSRSSQRGGGRWSD